MKSAVKKTSKAKGQRDLGATRQRILKAAAKEFAREGLQGARIDRIAQRSRANKAMIYYIFGNKETLHLAVLENLFEEKTKTMDRQLLANVPSLQELLTMLSSYLDAFLHNPDATRVIFHDMAAGASALKRLKKKRPDLIQPFRDISVRLKKLMDEGRIRSLDPDKAVLTTMLLLMALPVFLPHADMLHPKGAPLHENLTSPDQWKQFLADILTRALL